MLKRRAIDAVTDRVRRLTEVLTGLRDRVRAFVASEVSRAVAEAVRDLLNTLLGELFSDENAGSHPRPKSRHDGYSYHEEPDPWDEDDRPPPDEWAAYEDDEGTESAASSSPPVRRWVSAFRLGTAVTGWAGRHLPALAAAGVGVVVGVVAAIGGPLTDAVAALVAVAAEIIPHTSAS